MAQPSINRLLQQYHQDLGLRTAITAGEVDGLSIVHKFGRDPAATTTFAPVSQGGLYRTPQVAGATALRVKAGGNANDTAAGTGARTILLQGLDATGTLQTSTLTTAGASASAASSETYIRLFRAYVATSGTYASSSAGSHSAAITIEKAAGSEDWLTIGATDFPKGQSEVGCYTVPLGKVAYIPTYKFSTDSTKSTDLLLFQRRDILQTEAPYSAMRLVHEVQAVAGTGVIRPEVPFGPFPTLTDLGFMSKVSTGTGSVSVNFEIFLVDA